jgi:CheY-like chemotaxis protein
MSLILIADDELPQRILIREILSAEVSRIFLEAEDGRQAWEFMQHYHPDIAILDIMMPYLTGVEVCQRIKTDPNLSTIPVILLTARNNDEDRQKGEAAGCNDYLAKPFDPSELEQMVLHLLG